MSVRNTQGTETADTDVVTLTTVVEYGIRDELDPGYVHTMTTWHSPDDVLTDMHARGYTLFDRRDVVTRTTTTTTTGWEAAS